MYKSFRSSTARRDYDEAYRLLRCANRAHAWADEHAEHQTKALKGFVYASIFLDWPHGAKACRSFDDRDKFDPLGLPGRFRHELPF